MYNPNGITPWDGGWAVSASLRMGEAERKTREAQKRAQAAEANTNEWEAYAHKLERALSDTKKLYAKRVQEGRRAVSIQRAYKGQMVNYAAMAGMTEDEQKALIQQCIDEALEHLAEWNREDPISV